MLAALCVNQSRRRWKRFRLRPPAVKADLVRAGSGQYLKITAETGRGGVLDWTAIRRGAGREAGRLLLPRGVNPPIDSGIMPFAGIELARRLMELAAVAMLEIVAVNPRIVKISIYDLQATMPDLPISFLPFASEVCVVTLYPHRYAQQQYEAMHRYGAVLNVTNNSDCISGSLLVLVPNDMGMDFKEKLSAKGWVLCARNFSYSKKNTKGIIYGFIPRLSHKLLAAVPPGCDALQFMAGLYELSGVHEIADKPPEFMQTGGRTITLKDAAWMLAGIDIGISV